MSSIDVVTVKSSIRIPLRLRFRIWRHRRKTLKLEPWQQELLAEIARREEEVFLFGKSG